MSGGGSALKKKEQPTLSCVGGRISKGACHEDKEGRAVAIFMAKKEKILPGKGHGTPLGKKSITFLSKGESGDGEEACGTGQGRGRQTIS